MPTLADCQSVFRRLLRRVHIKVIVWDLDETLGASPGWINGKLRSYVYHPVVLKKLVLWLEARYGITSIIVSRNGAFCGNELVPAAREAFALGFHGVAKCPRIQMRRAKPDFVSRKLARPSQVLLLDDQRIECEMAQRHGSYAIHCPPGRGVLEVLTETDFEIYRP